MSEDFASLIESVGDEDFPLILRQQLESVDWADLPEDLRNALTIRAHYLGISIVQPVRKDLENGQ